MAFKQTRYLGGNRYESSCIKCGETFQWTDGDDRAHLIVYPDMDLGVLCTECYLLTKKPKKLPAKLRQHLEKRQHLDNLPVERS